MAIDRFDTIDRIATRIGERAERDGLASLSLVEKTVLLPWWASGIIGNGGFQYFYEGASEAAEVADAFDRIGCPAAAEACRKSLEVFPSGVPPADHEARRGFLDSIQDEDHTLFEPLDEIIWQITDNELESRLEIYIEANRQTLSPLL